MLENFRESIETGLQLTGIIFVRTILRSIFI
jgi:hypothetical protein